MAGTNHNMAGINHSNRPASSTDERNKKLPLQPIQPGKGQKKKIN